MKNLFSCSFAQSFRRLLPAAACGILLLLPAAPGHAVVGISWGTPVTIAGDSDVLNTNNLLYAYTFGNTSVPSATVNGVTFLSFAAPNGGAGPTSVGSVTLTLASDTINSTNTTTGSASTPFSNLSSNYKSLLQSGVADNTGNTMTFTLGGLTASTAYTIEVWVNDSTGTLTSSTGNPSENDGTIIHGLNSQTLDVNSTNAAGGMGQYVVGTLNAPVTSTNFTLTSSVAGGKPEIVAIQVRFVPEPASFGLLAVGGIILAGRRRRRA